MANAAGHVIGHVIIDSVPGLVPSSFSALVHGREPGPYLSGDAWLASLPGPVDGALADSDLALDDDPHGAPRP